MINDDQVSQAGHLTISPKMSFILGLVGGVMLLCTIGFFILLAVVLDGKSSNLAVGPTDIVDVVPTALAAEPPPGEELGEIKAISDTDQVWGSAKAPVDIIIYSDIECSYCGRFHDTVKQIQDQYGDSVRIAFRHFPLSFHPNAMPAALAVECAGDQGKFWEYLDELYESSDSLGEDLYHSIAADLGLNKSEFSDCFSSEEFQSKINDDRSSGSAAGISGTPGSIILGPDGSVQLIPGALPFDQVKPMINAALNQDFMFDNKAPLIKGGFIIFVPQVVVMHLPFLTAGIFYVSVKRSLTS